MKYINQNELIKQKDNAKDGTSKLFIHCLIAMCKELPPPQWQTIEEFKANPVDGCAFVKNIYIDEPVMTYTKNCVFYVAGSFLDSEFISHVMPIKTPEAPK